MLKLFRQGKLLVKIMLWVIVLMVGGMMVVTMVPGMTGNQQLIDPAGNLAQVGDSYVTPIEANRQVNQQLRQFGAVDNPVFRQMLLSQAVEGLIDRRALLYEANRLGLRVSEAEIVAQLKSMPGLYPGGEFIGREVYENMIQQQMGQTTGQFERQLADDLLLQKLNLWVSGGTQVTTTEIEQEYRRRNDKVRLDYVVLRPSDFLSKVQATEDDLRAFYESNKESFLLPERRSVRFVEINMDILQNRVTVSEEELERLYRERRAGYLEPEAVRVRHILFSVAAGTPKEETRKTAGEVLDSLVGGADFAQLVSKHSADPNSVDKGGEIGWIERGQTVPELEQKLFSLEPGSVPELVEVPYGFHIVQVLERRTERTRLLEEVRGELVVFLQQQAVQQGAIAEAQKIAQAVRNGKSLDEAAQEAGWQVSEFPLFPRDQFLPIVSGQDNAFQDAAFRLPLDADSQPAGEVSDPVSIPSGYAVIQLKEVSPAHTAEYDEVRVQVLTQYRQQRSGELMAETARKLSEAAQNSNLRSAVRGSRFSILTSKFVSRLGAIPEAGSVSDYASTVFALEKGAVSPALSVGANWVVFRLADRQLPDPAGLELARSILLEGLRSQKRDLVWAIFRSSVRKRLEDEGVIQINEAAMNSLLRRR